MRRIFSLLLVLCVASVVMGQSQRQRKSQMKDSVLLAGVTVTGKSKTQRLREGALAVNAIDVRSIVSSLTNLNTIVDRTAGVKVREEGGVGSDFDLSINGMSGNSVRYFIDGVPLDAKGSNVTLGNLPVNLIDHVEIYKGVVPTWLSSDALGGAVNIVTNRKKTNYLDASYGYGSFHTHRADLNAQYVLKNGLTIRPTFGLNYSKNDYMMRDVEVWDEDSRKYIEVDRRRFHDAYRSTIAQIEAGFSDKRWADEAFLTVNYAKTDKQLQTNQIQSKVIGMAERNGKAWGIGARYQKRHFLLRGLDANILLSHTWDKSVTVDTAYRKYNWDGEYIKSSRNEINGRGRMLRHYSRPLTIVKADLNYRLTDHHLLNLNYSLNRTGNSRWDDVDKNFEAADDALAKHILGLSYNQSFFDGRWQNTFFAKDYINHLSIEQTDIPSVTGSREKIGSNTNNYWGGGVATRFVLHDVLAVKASYERSVRLPLARELLGNGTTIYANVALEPEKSNNLNVGLFGTLHLNDEHIISYEVNGFLRHVDNFIQPELSEKEGTLQYINQPAVHIKGIEGELRYDWSQRLQFVGNISWQDARDRQEFKSDGKPSVTFNNHVPNRPWLYSTLGASYRQPRLFRSDDELRLGADYQWVHWFFLSWEGYGALETKARIPEKNVVDAHVTYAWLHQRYSLSLECSNLLDKTLYDNYKLQKPGRALFAKFRVFLH